jgi:hypothetical protein
VLGLVLLWFHFCPVRWPPLRSRVIAARPRAPPSPAVTETARAPLAVGHRPRAPHHKLGAPNRAAWASLVALSSVALAVGGILLWVDIANPAHLLAALLLGGIVAGGANVIPLRAIEQAALAETTANRAETQTYSVYNLFGYVAVALGALAPSPLYVLSVPTIAEFPPGPHDATFLFYGLLGLALVPVPRYWGRWPLLRLASTVAYIAVTWLALYGLWLVRRTPAGRALGGFVLAWLLMMSFTAPGLRHRLAAEWAFTLAAGVALAALSAARRGAPPPRPPPRTGPR